MNKLGEGLKVRYAKNKDLKWLQAQTPEGLKSITKFHIEQDQVIVAEFEGKLIGYILLTILWWKVPFINYIYVEKDFRRKGVGHTMVQFIQKELKEKGFDKLVGSAQSNEPESHIWHEKAGFKEIGEIDEVNEGDIGEVFFIKKI